MTSAAGPYAATRTQFLVSKVLPLFNYAGLMSSRLCMTLDELISKSHTLALPVMAECAKLRSIVDMAYIIEKCCTVYFFSNSHLVFGEGYGWNALTTYFSIPEISASEFVDACITGNSILTLTTHLLQQLLPSCSPQQEESFTDCELLQWITKIKVKTECHAEKLILLWGKAILLLVQQWCRGTDEIRVSIAIDNIVSACILIADDPVNSSFFGSIAGMVGLGPSSIYSTNMRLFSRAIAAVLSAQVCVNGVVRNGLSISCPSMRTENQLHQLCVLVSNKKKYKEVSLHADFAFNFASNPKHCLKDVPAFFSQMIIRLFGDKIPYLHCFAILP